MKIKDLKKLKIRVYKEDEFTLEEYLREDPNVELDDYLETLISDIQYDTNKRISELSKEEVIEYIKDYVFNDDIMEEILNNYYPEIDIK